MDRAVLLALLSLQVFLLITAFTSTDAALVRDPQQLPLDMVERRIDSNREIFGNRRKRYSHCGLRPGGCGLAGRVGPPRPPGPPPTPPPTPPPPPPRPEELRGWMFGNGRLDRVID